MNDEIKESINRIQSIVDFYKLDDENNYDYSDDVLISMKTLLDYITNLQEENEDLKDRLKVMKHFKNSLLEENEDYKSRCEKAIEFIKEEAGYDEEIRSCCCDLLYSDCDKLIELLGGDE